VAQAVVCRVALVRYGLVQQGGTFEGPWLLSPAPDNVSGPPHDLAFTRWGGGQPGWGDFENSGECDVGRREKFTPGHRSAFRAGSFGPEFAGRDKAPARAAPAAVAFVL
jgi:hypothetical protein